MSTTTAEPVGPPPAEDARPARRGRVTLVLSALLGLALVAAVVLGLLWFLAARAADPTAAARDAALEDARQAAINLTTVDSSDVAGTLEDWGAVVTGDLEANYAETRVQLEQQITSSPGRTEVTLVNAALTDLDPDAGTATALLFADVTRTSEGTEPSTQRFALRMDLQRTDDGWKASSLQSLVEQAAAQ